MTDAQEEARAERRAICEVEGVSEEEIQAIFLRYPDIYGNCVDKV